ncbi:MAG: hypothetical protein EON54_12195 [Alcaligenaceae bacterium]|nr:MAG: hypothetical protein EON54_12195 [Alcaligenaceae bacterium]
MNTRNKNAGALLLWLLLSVTVSSCGTKSASLPPPVVGDKPTALPLPSEIANIEPPPSGSYTTKLTARRKSSRERLSGTPMKSEP